VIPFYYGSGSGSDFLARYGSDFLRRYVSGSGSISQKVTVPTVPIPVPQRCKFESKNKFKPKNAIKTSVGLYCN
jgi:hypothetical protein